MTQPLRFSHLKAMSESPLHYYRARYSGDDASSESLTKGSVTHALVYGTPRVAIYDGIRRGKEWEAFRVANADAVICIASEYDPAARMAEAVRNDPVVRDLGLLGRAGATVEQTIFATMLGHDCRFTPDQYDRDVMVDLKTTRCAKPAWFEREMHKRCYPHALRWYQRGIDTAHGYMPRECYNIAVESAAPHPVVVYRITPKMLAYADRWITMQLEQVSACESSGHFPGYTQAPVDVDVPEWVVDDDDETEDEETSE